MTDEGLGRNSSGRHRAVLASLPILVSTHAVDGEGTYTGVYTSLQVKSTTAPEELVGSSLSDVLNDEATDELLSCAQDAIETGARQYAEFPVYFAGEEFWRGAYISPLRGNNGDDEVIIAGFDLTRYHEREDILYDVLDSLVTHTSRSDLENAFCERLVEGCRYAMAWIGGDDGDGTVEVRASAGFDGYLEDLDERFGGLDGTNEPGVCSAVSDATAGSFSTNDGDAWTVVAEEYDVQAGVALPLSHDGIDHGVLVVYTTDAEYLVPWREEVLVDYADAVGYALSAAMWRWSLTADTAAVINISFSGGVLSSLCEVTDLSSFEVESAVPRSDGSVYYLSADEDADLREAAEETYGAVPYGDGSNRLQAVFVKGDTAARGLTETGARVRKFRVTSEDAVLAAHLPNPDTVRSVVRRFRDAHPDATVSVEWGAPRTSGNTAKPGLETALTDRQREVLEAAYRHGYFERDPDCSLSEIAETLGLSRWTVSEHLRAAQGKLCSHVLD